MCAKLEAFLKEAALDVVGVFGYSDEDGTEGAALPDKLDADAVAERVARLTDLVEQLTAERAARRIGEDVEILVEEIDVEAGIAVGRSAVQGPDIDGQTTLPLAAGVGVGALVPARIVGSDGVDLEAVPR